MPVKTKSVSNPELIDRLRTVWREHNFEFGIPIIDLQHIYLLYTFIELGAVCDGGSEEKIATEYERAFSSILEFTSEHFFVEADIFRNFEFPEQMDHLQEHRHFIEKMKRRTREKIAGNREVARQLVGDLMSWLFDHILKEDKKFVQYYFQNNIFIDDYTRSLVNDNIIYVTPTQVHLYQAVTGSNEMFQIFKENISMTVYHLWKNYDLALNIPLLDMQNLWFINLMVRMDRASRIPDKKRKGEELLKGIDLLIRSSENHFQAEELLMEHFDFPDTLGHKREHIQFLEILNERKQEAIGGDLRAAGYLAQDLKEWLLSHIAINDKYFLWFFRGFKEEVSRFTRKMIGEKKMTIGKGEMNLYRLIRDIHLPGGSHDGAGRSPLIPANQNGKRKRMSVRDI